MSAHVPLYARGPYRVVAVPADAPRRYVVLDLAGAWLREEPTLDTACRWIDLRLAGRAVAPSRVPPPAR